MKEFSQALREKMAEKGLSIRKTAALAGCSARTISSAKKGELIPRSDIFLNICEALDIDILEVSDSFIHTEKRRFNSLREKNDNDFVESEVIRLIGLNCSIQQIRKITGRKDIYILSIVEECEKE